MKLVICDYKEPLHRDLGREISIFKEKLGPNTEVSIYEHHGNKKAFEEAIRDADGILTSYLEFPADIIGSAPKLRAISIEATGYNFVDAEAAERHGTSVCVIGEYCTQEVADHNMALMLAVARKLKHYQLEIEQKHRYDYNSTTGIIRLEGSTLGIMGLGKIGKAVARRAAGFGLHIVAYSPSCPPEAAEAVHARLVSKDELLARSDIISLNMRQTPQNEGILNRQAFLKMKKKPILVNVSRGALIVEKELIRALDEGRVSGAGLDVLEHETDEETRVNPLVGRENVVLTPHMAFYSDFSLYECQRIAAENLVYCLTGEKDKVFRMVNHAENPLLSFGHEGTDSKSKNR